MVEPWIEGLWGPLKHLLLGEDSNDAITTTTVSSEEAVEAIIEEKETKTSISSTQTVLVNDVIASLSDDLQRCTLNPTTPLSLPTPPASYLTVTLGQTANHEFPFNRVPYRLGSRVSMATISSSEQLTNEGAVKKTLEMTFRITVS